MRQIIYRTGSVFDAPPGAVLVHSCNGRGVWGAGVAVRMKSIFPAAYEKYRLRCANTPWEHLRGVAQVSHCPPYWIASLPVSRMMYGAYRDSPYEIVEATQAALQGLLSRESWGSEGRPSEFHSSRLNAGLLHVPWGRTEAVLREVVERHDVAWTVWTS